MHEISNNVVCASNKASDQPAHRGSLIRAFARLEYFMIVKLLTERRLEFLNLKLVRVYACQNVKLVEISCRGSLIVFLSEDGLCFTKQCRQRWSATLVWCHYELHHISLDIAHLCAACNAPIWDETLEKHYNEDKHIQNIHLGRIFLDISSEITFVSSVHTLP